MRLGRFGSPEAVRYLLHFARRTEPRQPDARPKYRRHYGHQDQWRCVSRLCDYRHHERLEHFERHSRRRAAACLQRRRYDFPGSSVTALGNIPTGLTMAGYLNATRGTRRRGLRGLCCRLPDWLVKKDKPKEQPAPDPAPAPSTWKSTTGWVAAGLGSTGLLQGLDQITPTRLPRCSSISRLHTGDTLTWVLQHPTVLVPVAIVECCSSRWRAPDRPVPVRSLPAAAACRVRASFRGSHAFAARCDRQQSPQADGDPSA